MNPYDFPLKKLLGILTIPILCLQNWVFSSIPNYYLQHWFIYFALLTILLYWKTGVFSFSQFLAKYAFVLALLGVVILAQAASLAISTMDLYAEQWLGHFLAALGKLAAQLPFVLVLLAFWDMLILDIAIHKHVVFGGMVFLALLLAICGLQLLYILLTQTYPLSSHGHGDTLVPLLNGISTIFEARWKDAVYDFYSNGSYVTTVHRINGIFEEASFLAVNISTFLCPFALGSPYPLPAASRAFS